MSSSLEVKPPIKDEPIMLRRHNIHFFYHEQGDAKFADQERQCHYCQFRKWSSHELYPMSIVFPVDTKLIIPKNFEFIEKNIYRKGVELADEAFTTGCECEDDLQCMQKGCHCLQDVDDADLLHGAKLNSYHVVGERKGCLRGDMLKSRKPIYECHEKCRCSDRCANRVVGKGRKVNLQVFPTENGRGWGVRATEDIKRGQYVGSYVGEVITPEEAWKRRHESSSIQKKDIYLFALDKFLDPASADERLRGDPYEIDGEFFAGPTRFINHSCDPNLRIFAVVTDHANKPFHDLCFFALKDIERETELTFDYTDGVKNGGKSINDLTAAETANMTVCLCGAKNCRGHLW